jgi:hypothetical protein
MPEIPPSPSASGTPSSPPLTNPLQTLFDLYSALREVSDLTNNLEAQLKAAKERRDQLEVSHIPQLMSDLGINEITMRDGRTISIKPQYFGSVAQTRMAQAVQWLEARSMDGIVDRKLEVTDWDAALLTLLAERQIDHSVKQSIHPSRLRAFVKERIEANDPDFPRELFAASVVNRAVISDRT